MLALLWQWLKQNRKHLTRLLVILFLLFGLKKGLLDRYKSLSNIEHLIKKGSFRKVLLGSLLIIGFLKGQPWYKSFVIGSMYPKNPEEIYQLASKYKVKDVSGLLPNESQIAQALAFGIWFYLVYSMIKNIHDQNSYQAKRKDDNNSSEKSFEDVGGCESAKKAILDILDFLKRPDHYQEHGITMPKGLLLYGKPGTGKTLVAKAAASQANIPVLYSSGSDFVEVFVGLGAKRIRNLFSQARELSKKAGACMIFIDEIDAVGYKR